MRLVIPTWLSASFRIKTAIIRGIMKEPKEFAKISTPVNVPATKHSPVMTRKLGQPTPIVIHM